MSEDAANLAPGMLGFVRGNNRTALPLGSLVDIKLMWVLGTLTSSLVGQLMVTSTAFVRPAQAAPWDERVS